MHCSTRAHSIGGKPVCNRVLRRGDKKHGVFDTFYDHDQGRQVTEWFCCRDHFLAYGYSSPVGYSATPLRSTKSVPTKLKGFSRGAKSKNWRARHTGKK